MLKGEKHPSSKLTDIQVTVIREMINEGITHKEIMNAFGINRNLLASISSNHSWKHIDPEGNAVKGRHDIKRFNEGYSERL